MSSHPLSPPKGEPKTVGELLARACRFGKRRASGSVFEFISLDGIMGDQFRGFALRINRFRPYDQILEAHKTLQSPQNLLVNLHMGQPLMVCDDEPDFSLVKEEEGPSLFQWHERLTGRFKTAPNIRTALRLTDMVLETSEGTNPFVPILERLCRLRQDGVLPDLGTSKNFLLKKGGTITPVDQLTHTRPRSSRDDISQLLLISKNCLKDYLLCVRMEQSRDEMDYFRTTPLQQELIDPAVPESLKRQYKERAAQITRLFDEAEATVRERFATTPFPPCFAAMDQTQSVALSDPPYKLRTLLQRMQARVDQPAEMKL